MQIDFTFAPRFTCEVIDELPGGPSSVHYFPGDHAGGRDGVLVRFRPSGGNAWIGMFAFGKFGSAGTTRVVDMPDADKLCVVARGAGYIANANDPNDWAPVDVTPVIDVFPVREAGLVVFASHTDLVAYDQRGLAWRTDRLAWDGFTILSVDSRRLVGEYWDIRTEAMQRFVVDLRTGEASTELEPIASLEGPADVATLVQHLRDASRCDVLPPSGRPTVRSPYRLPDDAAEFYELCGGVRLFVGAPYSITIVPPGGVTSSNPEIIGMELPDDMTDSWYIIAREGLNIITLDCHPERLGRCYDSFWDRHGIAGSSDIVALSFTELLRRLLETRGGYWYWCRDDFKGYGDAYDR